MMNHWGLTAIAAGLLAVGSAPASAVDAEWAGAGAVTGAMAYDQPIPAYLQACKKLHFTIALDSPAFTLQTPSGPQVVPLSVRGSGAEDCGSETLGGAGLTTQIDAGDLHCAAPGAYTRLGNAITYIAGGPNCRWGDSDAPGWNWTFNLVYADGRLAGIVTRVAR